MWWNDRFQLQLLHVISASTCSPLKVDAERKLNFSAVTKVGYNFVGPRRCVVLYCKLIST